MGIRKHAALWAGTSLAAFMLAAGPASAFNEVNWTWNATIEETIEKNVTINIEIDPTGMTMLEDLQVFIGDATAWSYVDGVYNNPPVEGLENGTLDLQWNYGLNGVLVDNGFQSEEIVDANVNETDGPDGSGINGTVTVTVDLGELGDPLDAVDLPEVVSAATAVGNNTSIEGDAAVQLHEGQFVFNVGDGDTETAVALGELAIEAMDTNINSNLVGAGLLGLAAIAGGIEASEITANSQVYNILNATVDSSATAVANNLTVDVNNEDGTGLLIGDVVQFAVANVNASSTVGNVSINGYTNLGALERPIVSSVATAVGNNKSITVGVPRVTP